MLCFQSTAEVTMRILQKINLLKWCTHSNCETIIGIGKVFGRYFPKSGIFSIFRQGIVRFLFHVGKNVFKPEKSPRLVPI